MGNVQDQFNSCGSGDFVFAPGEYEGPLRISRSCTVDGSYSTLWADRGPVLVVDSPNVTLKNFRVEVTGASSDRRAQIAIETTQPDTRFEKVEVNGQVVGFTGEADSWKLPLVLRLGTFAADANNIFRIELEAAADARLISKIRGIEISPLQLKAGKNILEIRTEKLRDNTVLYGEILVQTHVTRRVYVQGKAQKGAETHNDTGPALFHAAPVAARRPVRVSDSAGMVAPMVPQENVEYLQRGQRVSLGPYQGTVIRVVYGHKDVWKPMDIDGYIFLLQENGKVRRDEDMIFFGNKESAGHAVRISSAGNMPVALMDLGKLGSEVDTVSVCISIYGDNPSENFSLVEAPYIRIFSGDKEIYRFNLEGMRLEKTVEAVQVYRFKGDWRLRCVGAGYNKGLKVLCESFGVNIE